MRTPSSGTTGALPDCTATAAVAGGAGGVAPLTTAADGGVADADPVPLEGAEVEASTDSIFSRDEACLVTARRLAVKQLAGLQSERLTKTKGAAQ